jgi:hypothetical protein
MLKAYDEEKGGMFSNAREMLPPKPLLPRNYVDSIHLLLDWPPEEVARQISLIEL